jgi:hypothetical protein
LPGANHRVVAIERLDSARVPVPVRDRT